MMRHSLSDARRPGFTLVEVMIVVVVIAIIAGLVLPQFTDSTKNAKTSGARFNLQMMRKQVELYRQHHDGRLPGADLKEMLAKTNASGAIGTTAAYPYGPYLAEIPDNPFTEAATVRVATSNPPTAASGADDAGWLYHAATGQIWLDHEELLEE
jgi:prepilin-type N-terminal cleavage/methylation domain-containing protein